MATTLETYRARLTGIEEKIQEILETGEEYTVSGAYTIRNPKLLELEEEESLLRRKILILKGYGGRTAYNVGGVSSTASSAGGGYDATWGSITGTIADQLDLTPINIGAQPSDATLTALASLDVTTGLLRQTGADTFDKDTNTYLTTVGIGDLTGATTGAIPFGNDGSLTEDSTNLFWDDTNKRLGIGTTSPTYRLQVEGTDVISGGISTQSRLNFDLVANTDSRVLTLASSSTGGSIEEGKHYYFVHYVTALGETSTVYNSNITVGVGEDTVTIDDIPVSTDPRVTGRSLYRGKVGGSSDIGYFLTLINDNITTTYIDTTSDDDLTGTAYSAYYNPNTTSDYITVNGTSAMILDAKRTIVGNTSGSSLDGDSFITVIGADNFTNATHPTACVMVGSRNFKNATTGKYNFALGDLNGSSITSGSYNICIGSQALRYNQTGSSNTAIGTNALLGVNGNNMSSNTAVGSSAGRTLADGTYNTFIGLFAGYGDFQKTDATNSTALGYLSYNDADNQIVLGNSSITQTLLGRSDNNKLLFGAAQDASIYYDGTDMIINPSEVGTGQTIIDGRGLVIGSNGVEDTQLILYSDVTGASMQLSNHGNFADFTVSGNQNFGINSNGGSGYFTFRTNGTDKMRISSTGNVGIGTTTPAYKLHVAGLTSTDGIQVDTGLNFKQVTAPDLPTLELIEDGTGSIPDGIHYYYLSYVTAVGETDVKHGANGITTDATHNKVTVTIPVSSDYRVTARKLYRTTTGSAYRYAPLLLATINDNTTTTYIDELDDTALTGGTVYYKSNTTNDFMTLNGAKVMTIDSITTTFGAYAGESITTGYINTLFGALAGRNITTGKNNTVFGYGSLNGNTTGSKNEILGDMCYYRINGSSNIGIGSYIGYTLTSGNNNVIIGGMNNTNSSATAINNNVMIGMGCGHDMITNQAGDIFLGHYSGWYETGNYALIIDSIGRGSEALGRSEAIIYGTMSTTATNQHLYLGGTGMVHLKADNSKLYFGLSDDASIHYDGTDLCINTKEVGSGTIKINGVQAASGTFTTADAKTVTVTDGIITSIV